MKCESLTRPRMEPSDNKDLHPGDSSSSPGSKSAESSSGVLSSSPTSALSFLSSGSEDSGSSSSSSDFSSASGESGEIPADLMAEAVAPRLLMEADTAADLDPQVRERCVGRHARVSWGSTSVIGRRREMEDALAVVPGFMSRACRHVGGCTAPGSGSSDEISPVHFFGVYDGHGGSEVANFCAERMHQIIVDECNKEEINGSEWRRKWETTLSKAFERTDEEVFRDSIANEMVGTTAVVALVSGCQIILSNCGDSRAVLCRGTQTIPLTVDQKPDREDELMRIEGEGGKVINWNGARVLGVLAMSRAIGDRYMRPYVIPVPEISFTTRTAEDECVVLASDGLWEVMSSDEVGMYSRRLLRKGRRNMVAGGPSPAQFTADKLREMAIAKSSSDNITIIVVDLKSRRRHQQPRQADDR